MIRKILTYYAERLEEYLSRSHRRPEGLATVGMIGNSTEERPNKMVVSLLNVERETAGGGSSTSAHCHGYAFDLVPTNGQMRAFKRFCRAFLAGRAFDQLISEKEDKNGVPSWMHVGYKHPDGKRQRRQCYSMIHGKYYKMTD